MLDSNIVSTDLYIYSTGAQCVAAITGVLFAVAIFRNQYLYQFKSKLSERLLQDLERLGDIEMRAEPEEGTARGVYETLRLDAIETVKEQSNYIERQHELIGSTNTEIIRISIFAFALIAYSLMAMNAAPVESLVPWGFGRLTLRGVFIIGICYYLYWVYHWASRVLPGYTKPEDDDEEAK